MNKPVCLGRSILKITKILIYEFLYDYVKPNTEEKQIYVTQLQFYSLQKTDITVDITEDGETRL